MRVTGIGSELTVDGVHSDVVLTVPQSLVYSAEISSRMGSITHQADSSFSEEIVRGRHSLRRQLSGAINVKLNTSYGDIILKAGTEEKNPIQE